MQINPANKQNKNIKWSESPWNPSSRRVKGLGRRDRENDTYLSIPNRCFLLVTRLNNTTQIYIIANFEFIHWFHLKAFHVTGDVCIVHRLEVPNLNSNIAQSTTRQKVQRAKRKVYQLIIFCNHFQCGFTSDTKHHHHHHHHHITVIICYHCHYQTTTNSSFSVIKVKQRTEIKHVYTVMYNNA